ncbi:MAG TPA: RICIN domain-containing protein [Allosphingosinicella sp.]
MKDIARTIGRAALGIAAAMAASLALAGNAQAQFRGPGVYIIKFADTNQVLDIDNILGHGGRLGQHVLRWGANGGRNQKFIIYPNEDGYVIRGYDSLYCLDLPGWQTAVDVEIVQYYCTRQGNQRFYIESTPHGTIIRSAHGNRFLYADREGGRIKLASATSDPSVGMVFDFVEQ